MPRMFRKDCRYTVRPRWTSDSVCLSPFVPSTPQSDNPVRPPRIPFYSLLYLLTREKTHKRSIRNLLSRSLIIERASSELTWDAAAEFIGELGDEIIVDAILERSENDHGTRVLYRQLLHGLVRKNVLFAACNRSNQCSRHDFATRPPFTEEGLYRRVIVSNLVFSQTPDGIEVHPHNKEATLLKDKYDSPLSKISVINWHFHAGQCYTKNGELAGSRSKRSDSGLTDQEFSDDQQPRLFPSGHPARAFRFKDKSIRTFLSLDESRACSRVRSKQKGGE